MTKMTLHQMIAQRHGISQTSKPSAPTTTKPTQPKYSGRCRSCHGPIMNAPHHRAMGGLCGNCAFDEYDM